MARLTYDDAPAEKQFNENDVKQKIPEGAKDWPNGYRTMSIGTYEMPQMGQASDYREPKKSK